MRLADSNAVKGCRDFGYEPLTDWAELPIGLRLVEATGVATDSAGRVHVFHRFEHRVLVFEPDGTFIRAWGEGCFARPHGITIGPDDSVWCTDDLDHTVRKYSPGGELLLMLGTSGKSSDTGATSVDYRTIRRAGPPFHYPTNVALGPEGEVFVSDGYGNARIHKFSPAGRLIGSWGEPGSGPGQFQIPHGIAVGSNGTVYVADRENSRIQVFSAEGEYLTEWTDVVRPCQVYLGPGGEVYVAELGYRAGMWPGTMAPSAEAPGGRLSIFTRAGELVARWGGGEKPADPGDFFAPHDLCVDGRGDIYIAEVVRSALREAHDKHLKYHTLQKFVRRREK